MDRQTLIYIALGLVAVLLLSNMMRPQISAPVVNLPGSSSSDNKDIAYYANQIAKIDFNAIGNAIDTVFGKK